MRWPTWTFRDARDPKIVKHTCTKYQKTQNPTWAEKEKEKKIEDDITIPATEIEISEAMFVSLAPIRLLIRKLAFERDILRSEIKLLRRRNEIIFRNRNF